MLLRNASKVVMYFALTGSLPFHGGWRLFEVVTSGRGWTPSKSVNLSLPAACMKKVFQ